MNKRVKIVAMFSVFCLIATLSSCSKKPNSSEDAFGNAVESDDNSVKPVFQQMDPSKDDEKYEKIAYAGDNIPISRALAAKMLTYIESDTISIDAMERIITFKDTSPDDWYDRYINGAITSNYMSGAGDEFMPDKPLTLEHAQILLDKADPSNKVKIQITDENKNKAISYALWTDLYYKLLTNLSGENNIYDKTGIEKVSIIPLATPGNNGKLKDWNMITSTGHLSYKGLSMEDYIDKKISVLKKGDEVIAFLGIVDYAPIIKNAYLVNKTDLSVTVFIGGTERIYSYDGKDLADGTICDIKINGSKAETVTTYNEKTNGTTKKITNEMIEIENIGQKALADDVTIYSIVDDVPKIKTLNDVTVGTDIAEYYIFNGKIISIVIKKETLPQTLRIALNTTGFNGLVHENISLTCDSKYTVRMGMESKSYGANELFSISKEDIKKMFSGDVTRIYVQPNDKSGKIQINSLSRGWADNESPKYRGKLEIAPEEDGLSVVNEVSMDEYLYAVIPSEMPASHGLEAAKIQAVTARSYAYKQYYSNRFRKQGAHVDDSVSSQVYNNTPETEMSIKAVDETTGQCLTYKGDVISANFFSTSSGMTANSGEVWSSSATNQFPVGSETYVTSVKQYTTGNYGSLHIEENAYKFFKDMSVVGYDSSFPWFRWNVEMTRGEISAAINANIKARYEANPKLILTLDKDNKYKNLPIETIGSVKDLEITERGEGGNITKLKVVGENATVLIMTEYNIRMIIKPKKILDEGKDIVITRKDGSQITNNSLMPSAFFVIDRTVNDDGSLAKVLFSGGGNGHGVGLSQNGAKGMIDQGFKFDEILKHYYKSTEIKKVM